MKNNIMFAIFIALSSVAYSQIELTIPSSNEKYSLEKEDAKKYSIKFLSIDTSKKYTIIAKDTHSNLGKEYAVANRVDYEIDSLELTKDKPIEIIVKVKDASDVILSESEWTIFLKKKDKSYKEEVKAIMDSINKEEKKTSIVGHLRYLIDSKDNIEVKFKEPKKTEDSTKAKKPKTYFKPDSIELKIRRGSIKDIRVFGKIYSVGIAAADTDSSVHADVDTDDDTDSDSDAGGDIDADTGTSEGDTDADDDTDTGTDDDIDTDSDAGGNKAIASNDDGESVVFGRENKSIDIFKINDESQGKVFTSYNNKRYLKLLYPKQNEDHYIKLSEILAYDYVMGKKFFPKDTIIPMIKTNSKSNEKKIPLYKDVHLNSYLEGRIYTDVIGLNGEEANGVAQAEIKAHFNLNTQSNFAFVEPSLHYSKFTKDNDFVVLDSIQSKALTDFHRQSFLSVGLKLNIIKREFGDRYDLEYLNIGSQYSWTRLKDITSTTDITNTVHLFNSFLEIKGKMNEFHNFGISLGSKLLYELPVQDQNLDLDPFSWYIIPELEIFYYPVENKNNTVYLRITYTSNTRNHDYDYPSLQFGYKFRIKLSQR